MGTVLLRTRPKESVIRHASANCHATVAIRIPPTETHSEFLIGHHLSLVLFII